MTTRGSSKVRIGPRRGLLAALDVGSSKACCFVARADDADHIRIVGIGHQVSQGVRGGAIVDMEAAAAAIGNAVHSAEQMCGETIRSVIVNVTGGQPTSRTVSADVGVLNNEVGDADLRRALASCRAQNKLGQGELIHAIPVGYTLDGSNGIRDPRGMFGERLGVALHVVTADPIPVRNLTTCIARNHLSVESIVASSYAAGLACLVEDEMALGVTCIEMGGGTTSFSVFFDGQVVFTDCIAVGGSHVTNDIARGLNTPLVHAERMKILHGHAIASGADERELIDVPQVGEEDRGQISQVPKSLLVGIVQPRIEEIFELVRTRLEESGFAKLAGRRVVLSGGASQLPGVRELAQLVLDKQVRLGRPLGVSGLGEATGGPTFTACAGLLLHAVRQPTEIPVDASGLSFGGGLWERVGSWLRENL